MNEANSPAIILRANREHGGIRIATMLTLVFGLLGGFILIRVLLQWFAQGSLILEFATFISCLGAIALALALAWFVERYLKQTWSSGQEFELGTDVLRYEGGVKDNGQPDVRVVDFDKRVNLTRWFFKLTGYPKAGREKLVSDKSLCMAVQVQQDGERIIAYSYVPPEDANEWLDNAELDEPFQQISLAQLYSDTGHRRWNGPTRPEIPSEILASPDGRYWIAERRRWEEGLELIPEDFDQLNGYLDEKINPDPD